MTPPVFSGPRPRIIVSFTSRWRLGEEICKYGRFLNWGIFGSYTHCNFVNGCSRCMRKSLMLVLDKCITRRKLPHPSRLKLTNKFRQASLPADAPTTIKIWGAYFMALGSDTSKTGLILRPPITRLKDNGIKKSRTRTQWKKKKIKFCEN